MKLMYKRLFGSAAALAVLAMIVAACGGADPTATPQPTATPAPTATPPATSNPDADPDGDARASDPDSSGPPAQVRRGPPDQDPL